ncbi:MULTISPECIES: N-6 DNA methylase [Paenibacillus]|uniref:site-specific DNA-methyltransferase (adenine-specific) n=1 Tax=Paenibacillus borealis TaxID=160799 RepID=A0ABX3HIJ4_PAEBO|nr:N-6 DNA methylase [Paenibacillus borealis]OMD49512.1 hypothetical protein BSK56_09160 [Paenibacillus borealis]
MNKRENELKYILESITEDLEGLYPNEQIARMILVIVTIFYLRELEYSEKDQVSRAVLSESRSIAHMLDQTVIELEHLHKEFKGVFTGLVPSFLQYNYSDTVFKTMIEKIINIQFIDQEEIVQFINFIALKYSSNNGGNQTPETIIKLVLGLIDFKNISSVADYCSGISSFAIELFRHFRVEGSNKPVSYYGEEKNASDYLISKLLLNINNIPFFHITNKDVLDRIYREPERLTVDFIWSDAPFGMVWNQSEGQNDPRYKYGIPPKSSADWAFYQNALYHLNNHGQAAVVGTKGTLVRSTEVHIRKAITEEDLIEAVITLPENLYLKTRVGTELIIFNKAKSKSRRGLILFIDASKYTQRLNRNQCSIQEEGISKIVYAYRNGIEEENFSRFVDLAKIREYDYSLNPKEYLDFDVLKHSFHQTVKLGEIAAIRRGVQLTKEELEELSNTATHYLLNIKDIENGRIAYDEESRITYKKQDWLEKFAIRPMDIIMTSKGSVVKFAIVEEKCEEAFVSGNLSIIRVDHALYNVYVLYEFLQSEVGRRMLDGLQTGTTIKLINPSKLEKFEIPLLSIDLMNRVGAELRENKRKYEEQIQEAEQRFSLERGWLLEQIGMSNSPGGGAYGREI